jgi:DNA-binding CsgD family transcriptional regulator
MPIAWDADIRVLTGWQLEFDIDQDGFFDQALAGGRANGDVARSYWWAPASQMTGDLNESMVLAVPVLGTDGALLGVCGLEVSEMLFKLRYAPESNQFPGMFVSLGPALPDGAIDLAGALVAGHRDTKPAERTLRAAAGNDYPATFRGDRGAYRGDALPVALYPKGSVHADEVWEVATLIPADEVARFEGQANRSVIGPLVGLAVVFLALGVLAIRQLLAPLARALEQAKAGRLDERTHIREIDDLFAYLAEQDAARDAATGGTPTPDAPAPAELTDSEFSRRLATLTAAETAVFNLYAEGYVAGEVSELLCLSMNTIKTHNRHIYQKLGVSSRRELLAHLRALRKGAPARLWLLEGEPVGQGTGPAGPSDQG